MTSEEAFQLAQQSVHASFVDAGDFELGASKEDLQEIELHILANLAMAFGQTGE